MIADMERKRAAEESAKRAAASAASVHKSQHPDGSNDELRKRLNELEEANKRLVRSYNTINTTLFVYIYF